MRSLLLFLVCLILFGMCGRGVAHAKHPDFFPLEKGNYWVYRGETKFLVPKQNATEDEKQKGIANEEKSEVLTWKMEVVDTQQRPNVFAALIKGGPWDLAWYEMNKPRGDYVILKWGKIYYLYSGEEAQKTWFQLKKSKPSIPFPSMVQKELFESGEMLLKFPMQEGKTIEGKPAKDYEWVVHSVSPLDTKHFPGAEKFPDATEYALSYRARPEYMFLCFATGVGITSYSYAHHGTLAETDLQLIELGNTQPHGEDQTNAELKKKPVKAEIVPTKTENPDFGNVRVTYEDGSSDLWTKKGGCHSAHVASDGTVGWVVDENLGIPDHPHAILSKLILCRQGQIIAKVCADCPVITNWVFLPSGKQLVIHANWYHASPRGIYALFDVATNAQLQTVPEDEKNLPDWAKVLKAEEEKL